MRNRKLAVLLIIIAFTALVINVFGQTATNSIVFRKTGTSKKSIIFIPGFSCSGDVWNDTRILFEDSYTCYTLTMPGFAGAPPQPDITFRGWEERIAAFITANELGKPVIIGHSMGGGLAMALAADHPDLVSKIVVVDGLPCLAALMNPAFKSKENNDCSASVGKFTSMTNDEFYKMQQQSIPQLLADTSKQELVLGWSVRSDRRTFAEMYCDFSNTDLRNKIAAIKCPALILLESYFSNIKEMIGNQFSGLKTADIRYATKGLHFVMFDDTKWYDQQLTGFLK